MAQFRSTADILDEILLRAGEVTNGNSPYETNAVTYANRMHHAIIGGGSIFELNVDEPWVWARSRHPIVLELLPAYSAGAVACTVNDINISFSVAPSVSLEGWHFQVNSKNTVYKIMQHTAGAVSAVLDSAFVDDSSSYSFRAMKLDYEVLPTYLYVDNYNDRLDFTEGTAATVRTASLTHGAYTLSNYITHVASRMQAVSTSTITGAYDDVLKQYSLTASSSLALLGASGTNARRSGLDTLGFDCLDYTGAQAYTASYIPNGVARLIEPIKVFNSNRDHTQIMSTDPIRMEEDYPISRVRETIPQRFCRIGERSDGTIIIRFSSYPKFKTKATLDWIPVPHDLQDNAVSVPKLPRQDVETLICGAAAMIAFDKSDNKFEMLMNLAGRGLDAMKLKNQGLLERTSDDYGTILPRQDLLRQWRRFEYGYTAGSPASGSTADTTQVQVGVTISYTSFQGPLTVFTVNARTLPSSRSLLSVLVKHTQSFTGTAITASAVDVGIAADPTFFINGFDVLQATAATAQASFVGLYYPGSDTPIQVRLTTSTGNTSALAAGTLVLYFQENVLT